MVELLLAIIIEAVAFSIFPLLIRIIAKRSIDKKYAIWIVVANYGLVFTLFRILALEVFGLNITNDLFSLILVFTNYIILTYDQDNKMHITKLLFAVIIVFMFIGSSLMYNSTMNYIKDKKEKKNNKQEVYRIKEIDSMKDFNKLIKSDKPVVIYYGYDECIYCTKALNILEKKVKENKLTNVYYFDVTNGDLNTDVDKLPTIIIYQNNEIIDIKEGYTNNLELDEAYYSMEIVTFLTDNNIIK